MWRELRKKILYLSLVLVLCSSLIILIGVGVNYCCGLLEIDWFKAGLGVFGALCLLLLGYELLQIFWAGDKWNS